MVEADARARATLEEAFGPCPKPVSFVNAAHCCECAEHDALLRERDRASITFADVGNPASDPFAFASPAGFAYYLPSLADMALEPPTNAGWYGDQLVFHLTTGGDYNSFYQFCTSNQRQAVGSFLTHLINTRAELLEHCADEVLRAVQRWSAA